MREARQSRQDHNHNIIHELRYASRLTVYISLYLSPICIHLHKSATPSSSVVLPPFRNNLLPLLQHTSCLIRAFFYLDFSLTTPHLPRCLILPPLRSPIVWDGALVQPSSSSTSAPPTSLQDLLSTHPLTPPLLPVRTVCAVFSLQHVRAAVLLSLLRLSMMTRT